MHDVRLMCDARDASKHKGALRCTAGVSASCFIWSALQIEVDKPLKIRERNYVIVLTTKLLITLKLQLPQGTNSPVSHSKMLFILGQLLNKFQLV